MRDSPKLRLCLTDRDVSQMIDDLSGLVSFDIETTGLHAWEKGAKINTIGFGTEKFDWVLPVGHEESPWSFAQVQRYVDRIESALDACQVVAHGGKFDTVWMNVHFGVWIEADEDTMLMHYIVDENSRHNLKTNKKAGPGIAQRLLNAPDWDIDDKSKKGGGSLRMLAHYQAHDLYFTRRLHPVLRRMIDADKPTKLVYEQIVRPVSTIFIEAQLDGIVVDAPKFDQAEDYLRGEIQKAESDLGKFASINWRSNKELTDLLYGKFKLPVKVRTPKGAPSCNESALNQMDHPCVSALLKLRAANQQLSFFIEGWKPWIHWNNGVAYLHPSFKLHGTVTGRPSSENPNLFQVPRDPRIRSLVTAEPGWTFVECDLSQIEMRLAAEVSKDPDLLHAFLHGIDVHWMTALREIERGRGLAELVTATAGRLTGKKLSYVECIEVMLEAGPDKCCEINSEWKEYRKKAKAINFGYLYGMWWKKFKQYARDNYGIEVTDKQAEASREAYFEMYPRLEPWHKRQKRFVNETGYVMSLAGRKRRLPDATQVKDEGRRKQAERQAINSPIQSFANDINFMAAIQLRKKYPRSKVKIVGTVYDAILMRVRNDLVEEVTEYLLEVLKKPDLFKTFGINLTVPIEGEAKIGPWGAGVSLEKWRKDVQGITVKSEAVAKVPSRLPPKARSKATKESSRPAPAIRDTRARDDRSEGLGKKPDVRTRQSRA